MRAGDFLELFAEIDLIAALSACPGGDCGSEHSSDAALCHPLRLEVSRGRDKALITRDRMRVDVVAEFYVRVQATEEAIINAMLAAKTMRGADGYVVPALPFLGLGVAASLVLDFPILEPALSNGHAVRNAN